MLKRLFIAMAIIAGLASSVQGAGTIPGISMSQQFDSLGKPLNGGLLYLVQAGTTATPQNCYQDSGLTRAWPNPITLDSAGRVPQIFCADGSIKIRLTNSVGVSQLVADNILIVGPSGGGGGGGSVDPTTILQTGQLIQMYGTGVLSGFVRANGRTIGSATSGGTERANADCQALFQYLWGADANLAVSGGRGASALADWSANKTITLPDARGLAMAGLDDMGNSARGVYTGVTFGNGNATTLGSALGAARRTLTTPNLPPYTPSGSISVSSTTSLVIQSSTGTHDNYGSIQGSCCITNQFVGGIVSTGSLSGNAQGGTSTPFDTISPYMLVTIYLKL